MKRGWLPILILSAVVAALAWLAWRTPSRDEAARATLSAVNPSNVTRIALRRAGDAPVMLEKQGGHWWLTAPFRARADEFQVLRMLTILEARPTARLPAADRARFELDPPAAVLDIDGVPYAFGGINTVTREQYVLHGDAIHAVELRHGAALPAKPAALVRRALLGENELPVALELPAFTVRKQDGRWTLTPPSDRAGADELQRYVDQWRMASAAAAEPYGRRKPVAEIRITMADGSTVTMGVLQREPQLLLWRQDNGLQYSFSTAASRTLLAGPAADTKNNQ
jgi:hypothetical protein